MRCPKCGEYGIGPADTHGCHDGQPIETAPTGRDVLGWFPGAGPSPLGDDLGYWSVAWYIGGRWWGAGTNDEPTHWRPLDAAAEEGDA